MKSSKFERELLGVRSFLAAFASKLAGRQDGEDLVQQTMMKAWEYRDSFVEGSNFKAWVFTIMRNEFYSQMRRKLNPRAKMISVGEFTDLHGVTQADQFDVVYLNQVSKAMSRLSPEHRKALILVGACGYSYEDAAKIMRCPEGTIKSRVTRARRELEDVT